MLDAGREIVRDAVMGEFERQDLPWCMLVQANDVKAVAGFSDSEFAGPRPLQRRLERGNRLAARQLTKPAALLRRGLAGRMAAGELGEQYWIGPDSRQDIFRHQPSLGACRDVVGTRGDQDMRRLIQVSRPETLAVLLVEP